MLRRNTTKLKARGPLATTASKGRGCMPAVASAWKTRRRHQARPDTRVALHFSAGFIDAGQLWITLDNRLTARAPRHTPR